MEILIASFYYYPEITPRAFRTHELVKEFCRLGHNVKLYLPDKPCFRNNIDFREGLEVSYSRINTITKTPNNNNNNINEPIKGKSIIKRLVPSSIKKLVKQFLEWRVSYFNPIRLKDYQDSLFVNLLKENKKFDLIISIALPVETHIAFAKALRKNKSLASSKVKVAEYGDPFSKQKNRIFPLYQWLDHFIARSFDYISVPTVKAVSSYTSFKKRSKILVLPQAFDLNSYKILPYTQNEKAKFAYAGVFYTKLRNPSRFLDYLVSLSIDFEFHLYTISESRDTKIIIDQYLGRLKEKLIVHYNIERENLITELSTMDFLINFENTSTNQVPSKLIDYAITDRPFCSIPTISLDTEIFNQFVNKNYEKEIKIDLSEYDIHKIAKQFIDLI